MAEVSSKIIDVEGHSGWISIEGTPISYITRIINGEQFKVVSVSMAETLVLGRYLNYFNPDIYKFLRLKGYYITNTEAKLLNDINAQNSSIGNHEVIAGKDCIVRLEDVQKFYTFLDLCHNKIESNINNHEIQFGYIVFKLNVHPSYVPFLTKEGQTYLPLFYFEDSIEQLSLETIELKSWDLAYLKFCFKVMGIYDELYDAESCTVIRLNDLRNFFPPETVFQEFWPQNMSFDTRIVNYSENQYKPSCWISDYLGFSIMPQESSTANNANQA